MRIFSFSLCVENSKDVTKEKKAHFKNCITTQLTLPVFDQSCMLHNYLNQIFWISRNSPKISIYWYSIYFVLIWHHLNFFRVKWSNLPRGSWVWPRGHLSWIVTKRIWRWQSTTVSTFWDWTTKKKTQMRSLTQVGHGYSKHEIDSIPFTNHSLFCCWLEISHTDFQANLYKIHTLFSVSHFWHLNYVLS